MDGKKKISIVISGLKEKIGKAVSFLTCKTYPDEEDYLIGNTEYDGKDLEKVIVDWVAGKVKLSVSDDGVIRIKEKISGADDDIYRVHSLLRGDVLNIHFAASGVNVYNLEKDLELEIPEGAAVEVETVSASFDCDDITCNGMTVKTISGGVELGDTFSRESVTIDSSSGDIFAESIRSDENVGIVTASGDVEIRAVACESLKISTTSGDIFAESIRSDENVVTGTVSGDVNIERLKSDVFRGESVSGDINIEKAEVSDKITFDSTSGDARLKDVSSEYVEVNSTSGEIELEIRDCEKLSADSTSGDVSLKFTSEEGAEIEFDSCSGVFRSRSPVEHRNDVKIVGNGKCSAKVSTVSGNLTVK